MTGYDGLAGHDYNSTNTVSESLTKSDFEGLLIKRGLKINDFYGRQAYTDARAMVIPW